MSLTGGSSVGIGNNAGSLKLPEGWGSSGAIGGGSAGGATGAATAEPVTPGQLGTPAAGRSTGVGGNPLLGHQASDDEDESADKGNDYLRGDHFGQGGLIAPGVIGADSAAESAR
ncbi:hypothetical protein [Nocardia wallacei]|uniref:hypothetical protein n=1 Tax=Nocardia wallacei TaxID=480035 RepID=UPI002455EF5F|nr:hypothetical protein [Nocardia wallacei]